MKVSDCMKYLVKSVLFFCFFSFQYNLFSSSADVDAAVQDVDDADTSNEQKVSRDSQQKTDQDDESSTQKSDEDLDNKSTLPDQKKAASDTTQEKSIDKDIDQKQEFIEEKTNQQAMASDQEQSLKKQSEQKATSKNKKSTQEDVHPSSEKTDISEKDSSKEKSADQKILSSEPSESEKENYQQVEKQKAESVTSPEKKRSSQEKKKPVDNQGYTKEDKEEQIAKEDQQKAKENKQIEQSENQQKIEKNQKNQGSEEQIAPEEEPETEIDTIDLDEGGNWLLKRKALEDTAETIEKINAIFIKIIDASTKYKIDRNKIDNELDLLITTIGFGLGDLDQALATLLEKIDQERKQEGDLSSTERDILHTTQEKKQEVTLLRDSLQGLFGLEQNIDNIVNTVDSQIKIASNYQSQAWKHFQEIKKVLSDEKAEDLYYRTEGLFQSMQDILNYLEQKLFSYFNEQIIELRNKMSEVRRKVQSLQDKGIDLKSKFEKVQEEEEKEHTEEKKQKIQQHEFFLIRWLKNIRSVLYIPFDYIQEGWRYLFSQSSQKSKKQETTLSLQTDQSTQNLPQVNNNQAR